MPFGTLVDIAKDHVAGPVLRWGRASMGIGGASYAYDPELTQRLADALFDFKGAAIVLAGVGIEWFLVKKERKRAAAAARAISQEVVAQSDAIKRGLK